jgi:hypothetical protein
MTLVILRRNDFSFSRQGTLCKINLPFCHKSRATLCLNVYRKEGYCSAGILNFQYYLAVFIRRQSYRAQFISVEFLSLLRTLCEMW